MTKLVECVPNFSEGRDRQIIDEITAEISRLPEITLLDVDPGRDTNRTVVTFVGPPAAAAEAAFNAIRKAAERIDMTRHKGAHARMGATDVCPFIPLSGVTMQDCAELARQLGERVGKELGIPVYLYENAARTPERRNLANIRQGEYEGFFEKIRKPEWKPDFGPDTFNAKAGGTVIGAREFLIAYNFNLNTRDKGLAQEIAFRIREQGRPLKDAEGKFVKDAQGEKRMIPGKFKNVKAVGWFIPDFKCAQVSMNLTDYRETPLHLVFDEVCKEAEQLGLRVTGCELVGLIPKAAMVEAGKYFLRKQKRSAGVPEPELVRMAVQTMGLGELYPFKPEEKIIEYRVSEKGDRVMDMNLRGFMDELSSDSPAPGGGTVAALGGACAASLAAMVANLTIGKKAYEKSWDAMNEAAEKAQKIKDRLLVLADEDTAAFNRVMDTFRLPKTTPEEKAVRQKATEEATQGATRVPLEVLRECLNILPLARSVAADGNKNSLSDAGVAAIFAKAAGQGALLNVMTNLKSLQDKAFIDATSKEAQSLWSQLQRDADSVVADVSRTLA